MAEPNEIVSGLPDGRQSQAALAIQRGARRLLWTLGLASVTELTLANWRRADIIGLSAKGEVWIIEIKSSLADFRADSKWPEYRAFCDKLYFAVDREFPQEVLPEDAGLIVADAYGAAILREPPVTPLAPARRKALTARFARVAAVRLQALGDPDFGLERME